MEKLKQSISKQYPQVILYLDDLTSIISILDENGFENIQIETDKHSYNKNEISLIKSEEQIREIKSTKPIYFSLTFENSFGAGRTRIYLGDDSVFSLGILQKIGNILKSRSRYFFYLLTRPWFSPILSFLFIVFFMIINQSLIKSTLFKVEIILCVIFILLCMFISITNIVANNIFYYKIKKELPNFILRNKDQVLSGLIISLISSAITYILTKLFS